MMVDAEGTRVAGVETSATMLVVVLALSCHQIWCYRGCYRMAGIQEREAEATVQAKAGAEVSGTAAVVMVTVGAAPHQNNCCRLPDSGQQDQQEFGLWRGTQMHPMAGG